MTFEDLKHFLDEKADQYNHPSFIANDPISIPHGYTRLQDVEIAGLFAAILAWGQRKTIINKCHELFRMMDDQPYDFIMNHKEGDLKPFLKFKHRTFNDIDTLYFITFLRSFYTRHNSIEIAFLSGENHQFESLENSLIYFHKIFFSLPDHPHRTKKHIATPARKSACKRLNMFLRWMVRRDDRGVDFGIWKQIPMSELICPCDVHVDRVARKLKLINRKQTDWQTALELTTKLRQFEPSDPVKYDYALFGLGIEEKF